jgi:hypothetical protein
MSIHRDIYVIQDLNDHKVVHLVIIRRIKNAILLWYLLDHNLEGGLCLIASRVAGTVVFLHCIKELLG